MSDPRFWMQTYTNRPFRFDDLSSNEVDIKDIARSLSRIPRFNGHASKHLSVAEHSLAVSHALKEKKYSTLVQMHGLLHDAHEAYTGDIISPFQRYLKECHGISFKRIQADIQTHIHKQLQVADLTDGGDLNSIGDADLLCCKIERDLFARSSLEWDIDTYVTYEYDLSRVLYDRTRVMSPLEANSAFIELYYDLKKGLGQC